MFRLPVAADVPWHVPTAYVCVYMTATWLCRGAKFCAHSDNRASVTASLLTHTQLYNRICVSFRTASLRDYIFGSSAFRLLKAAVGNTAEPPVRRS